MARAFRLFGHYFDYRKMLENDKFNCQYVLLKGDFTCHESVPSWHLWAIFFTFFIIYLKNITWPIWFSSSLKYKPLQFCKCQMNQLLTGIVYLRINYYFLKVGIPWDKRFHWRIRMLLEDGLDSALSNNKRRRKMKKLLIDFTLCCWENFCINKLWNKSRHSRFIQRSLQCKEFAF